MKACKSTVFTFSFLMIFLAWSCGRKTSDNEGKTVFRYNESAGITSLDPAFAKDQANIWACNQLFNGLVQLDENLIVEPAIAYKWEINEEGRLYTFFLRDDVFFHNHVLLGPDSTRKVLATDFVYSLNRLISESVASPGYWIMNQVARINSETLDIKALSDTVLQIRLNNSFPPFLSLLSMQYCSVIPPEVVDFMGEDFRFNPIGTGPFYHQYWKEGNKLVLLKNELYWEFEGGERLPYLDAVAISFIIDKQSAFLEFVKGNLEFLSGIDASYKDELLSPAGELKEKYSDRIDLLSCSYLNTEYLGFLVDEKIVEPNHPLLNSNIRKALNYGFDRVKMIRYLRNNIGYPAVHGFVPPGMPGFGSDSKIKGYHYNSVLAKELLAKEGYGPGMKKIELSLNTTSAYLDLCNYIQAEYSRLGIDLKIVVNQASSLRDLISQSKVGFFRGSWIADYPDAENYLALFSSENFTPSGPNYTHYSNQQYDVVYKQTFEEWNDSIRFDSYHELDQMIMDDAVIIPLYYDKVVRFKQKNVHGLGINSMNLLNLKRVRVE